MKTYFILCLMVTHAVSSSLQEEVKTQGSFHATINGADFQVREDQLYRGLLINRAASMDGRIPARTVVNAVFSGPTKQNKEEKLTSDNIQFEIGYEPDKTGVPSSYLVALQYHNNNYYMVKESSKVDITDFNWESDKKHFNLSADFNCTMRSFGYPSDGIKDIELKGDMENIKITVPSWLAEKN